jgi:hypothetical protein
MKSFFFPAEEVVYVSIEWSETWEVLCAGGSVICSEQTYEDAKKSKHSFSARRFGFLLSFSPAQIDADDETIAQIQLRSEIRSRCSR